MQTTIDAEPTKMRTSNRWNMPDSTMNRWLIWSVGIYMALVLNLLEPFGINIKSFFLIYHLILASYGVVAALAVAAWLYWLQPYISQRWPRVGQHKVIMLLLVLVLVASLSNWLYSQFLHHTISGWHHMYVPTRSFTELMPQLLALYAVWGFVCWVNLYFLYTNKMQRSVAGQDEQPVTLYSENQSDNFRVKLKQLIGLKTCDNYLQVFYLDENQVLQDRLLRSSMKRMELQLGSEVFFRCHQSYLMNLNYVKGISKVKNNHFLEMSYLDFDVAVSRKNLKHLKTYIAT